MEPSNNRLRNPSGQKRAVDELLRGQELATKLKIVLLKSREEDEAKDLAAKVLNSFSNTLSILNNSRVVDSDEVSQFPARTRQGSPYSDSRKYEDSGESSKCHTLIKDRRGCYKRRKTCRSWTSDGTTLVDDGHAWRKYGQKEILNAKYPRNYFRCTHKYDQGCQATKQVQRIEEDPPMYRTTYYGLHTCKSNLLNDSQIFADSIDADSSIILSFSNNNNNNNNNFGIKQDGPFCTSFPSIKQEYYDGEAIPLPSDLTHNQCSSSDYVLSPDRDHLSTFDRVDVISGVNSSSTTSTNSLDMGLMVGTIDFADEFLQFVEFS